MYINTMPTVVYSDNVFTCTKGVLYLYLLNSLLLCTNICHELGHIVKFNSSVTYELTKHELKITRVHTYSLRKIMAAMVKTSPALPPLRKEEVSGSTPIL